MVLFAAFVLLLIASLIAYAFFSDRTKYQETGTWVARVCLGLAIFFLVIMILANTFGFYDQVTAQEKVKQSIGVERIYNRRANDLIPQFKSLLAEEYPAYEAKIFGEINNTTAAVNFLGRYPEIKASETIIKLVDQIRDLRDSIYAQAIYRQDLQQQIRSRGRNPWLLTGLMP